VYIQLDSINCRVSRDLWPLGLGSTATYSAPAVGCWCYTRRAVTMIRATNTIFTRLITLYTRTAVICCPTSAIIVIVISIHRWRITVHISITRLYRVPARKQPSTKYGHGYDMISETYFTIALSYRWSVCWTIYLFYLFRFPSNSAVQTCIRYIEETRLSAGVTIHRTGPVQGRKWLIISLRGRIKRRKTS